MKIKVREWEDMVEEFGVCIEDGITYIPTGGNSFVEDMKYLCGRVIDADMCIRRGDRVIVVVDIDDDDEYDGGWELSPEMYEVIE